MYIIYCVLRASTIITFSMYYYIVDILILLAPQYTVYKNSLFWKRSVGVGKSAFSHYGLLS